MAADDHLSPWLQLGPQSHLIFCRVWQLRGPCQLHRLSIFTQNLKHVGWITCSWTDLFGAHFVRQSMNNCKPSDKSDISRVSRVAQWQSPTFSPDSISFRSLGRKIGRTGGYILCHWPWCRRGGSYSKLSCIWGFGDVQATWDPGRVWRVGIFRSNAWTYSPGMDLFTSEPNEKGRALPTWGDQSLVFCGQSPWAWGPLLAHVALCKHSFPTWFEGRVPFPTIVLLQDFITHDETFPKPSRKCFAQPDAFILQNIAQSKQEGRLIRCNSRTIKTNDHSGRGRRPGRRNIWQFDTDLFDSLSV